MFHPTRIPYMPIKILSNSLYWPKYCIKTIQFPVNICIFLLPGALSSTNFYKVLVILVSGYIWGLSTLVQPYASHVSCQNGIRWRSSTSAVYVAESTVALWGTNISPDRNAPQSASQTGIPWWPDWSLSSIQSGWPTSWEFRITIGRWWNSMVLKNDSSEKITLDHSL